MWHDGLLKMVEQRSLKAAALPQKGPVDKDKYEDISFLGWLFYKRTLAKDTCNISLLINSS